ncbi:MAG TPA: radical SAM protein [Candidatus Omnitrophica bacterium]|nr:radical SAM protein [Candidatus Omnitrophota bacterium]
MRVAEIFYSLLGESTYYGLPCAFVRLAGCNLRCTYCDTPQVQDEGEEYNVQQVLSILSGYPAKLVEITGGEPLLQEGVYELIQKLIERKYKILIETSGSIDIDRLPVEVVVIMDIKCPSSGMHERVRWENLGRLKQEDEIKFVVQNFDDYLWAREVIEKYNLSGRKILLSPVFNKLSPKILSEWILKDGLNVRLQLQLHKIIGIR